MDATRTDSRAWARVVIAAGLILILIGLTTATVRNLLSPSPEELVDAAVCSPQSGMTGNLPADIIGLWRWSWIPSQDGETSRMLLRFDEDRRAATTSGKYGIEMWSYRIIEPNRVRMWGADPGDDLQMLELTWKFNGGSWNVIADGAPGGSVLERCTSP